jgi:hypothetical protein
MYSLAHNLKELSQLIGEEYTKDVQKKFSNYLSLTKAFVVEEEYIDREWREEFSTFYSFTFYKGINQFTKRIHLIEKDIKEMNDIESLQNDDYLGYVVLRPVPAPNRILKGILVPRKEAFGVDQNSKLFMALCKFEPHIGGKAFCLRAFPFYSQDSMVTVCAHASMYMNGLFMHRKHGMNRPYFRDFVKFTTAYPGRVVPSQGLTPIQMATILANLGYSPVLELFETKKKDDLAECLNKIDAYIESALPPLLIYGPHVVSVVGHTLRNNEKDYILFDDSGYHLSKLVGQSVFGYKVTKKELSDALNKAKVAFVIGFEFERQYFPLKSIEALFKSPLEKETWRRILIVDSRKFKMQAKQKGVSAFENISFPHYLWLVEYYSNSKLFCEIIIDASAHKDDDNPVLAIWFQNQVKFYKPNARVIGGMIYPIPFSNLEEVKQ